MDAPLDVERKVRVAIPTLPVAQRAGFEEVDLVLDEEAAKAEAERCLNCRRCLGCKLCEEVCKPEAVNYLDGARGREGQRGQY